MLPDSSFAPIFPAESNMLLPFHKKAKCCDPFQGNRIFVICISLCGRPIGRPTRTEPALKLSGQPHLDALLDVQMGIIWKMQAAMRRRNPTMP